ncbi:MAG TPA: hypothetical protein VMB51_15760 [Solirubrobacteraceae bacterium]|nr:hypothetical protein [Solirubrobacteraceae bacterium]
MLALALLTVALSGCGGAKAGPAQMRLEREDLVATVHSLRSVEGSVDRELAAAKRAWPLVVNGLPAGSVQSVRAPVRAAAVSAALIPKPPLFEAHFLTGAATELAGLFMDFDGLSTRGWGLIGAAIDQIEAGNPANGQSSAARAAGSGRGASEASAGAGARSTAANSPNEASSGTGAGSTAARVAAARFARANVDLYIESVYDGHFELAQISEKLHKAYQNLGGPSAFGKSLTPAEVNAVAAAYSEASARLRPHVGVRLGS